MNRLRCLVCRMAPSGSHAPSAGRARPAVDRKGTTSKPSPPAPPQARTPRPRGDRPSLFVVIMSLPSSSIVVILILRCNLVILSVRPSSTCVISHVSWRSCPFASHAFWLSFACFLLVFSQRPFCVLIGIRFCLVMSRAVAFAGALKRPRLTFATHALVSLILSSRWCSHCPHFCSLEHAFVPSSPAAPVAPRAWSSSHVTCPRHHLSPFLCRCPQTPCFFSSSYASLRQHVSSLKLPHLVPHRMPRCHAILVIFKVVLRPPASTPDNGVIDALFRLLGVLPPSSSHGTSKSPSPSSSWLPSPASTSQPQQQEQPSLRQRGTRASSDAPPRALVA